ncbi:MAG TPA: molybdopterin cofactor-binding domain-containing protein, partial [Syntrophales bacterium]|nr:molybdopterin cofactor-binding domain-containing protein [Syntrophales bacterium]
MRDYLVVGKPLPRVDALAKATGAARYVADMGIPRMLSGKILRATVPHARILHIDTRQARRLVGVKAIITGEDTAKKKYGIFPWLPQAVDHYPIAVDKVRFIGEEVAAVAAVDEETAAEAVNLIRVDYEELPSVFDPIEAVKTGAPEIHEGVKDNQAFFTRLDFGDVEAAFAECDYVREDEFTTPYISQAPIETHAALAAADP